LAENCCDNRKSWRLFNSTARRLRRFKAGVLLAKVSAVQLMAIAGGSWCPVVSAGSAAGFDQFHHLQEQSDAFAQRQLSNIFERRRRPALRLRN